MVESPLDEFKVNKTMANRFTAEHCDGPSRTHSGHIWERLGRKTHDLRLARTGQMIWQNIDEYRHRRSPGTLWRSSGACRSACSFIRRHDPSYASIRRPISTVDSRSASSGMVVRCQPPMTTRAAGLKYDLSRGTLGMAALKGNRSRSHLSHRGLSSAVHV